MALPLPGGRITGLQWSGKNDAVAIGHVDSSENTSVIHGMLLAMALLCTSACCWC